MTGRYIVAGSVAHPYQSGLAVLIVLVAALIAAGCARLLVALLKLAWALTRLGFLSATALIERFLGTP